MELVHKDDVDPETARCWQGLCHDTTLAMQDHCMRYITPISHAVEHEWGLLEGTGAYIGLEEQRLLLSCEHVLRDFETRQFCHQFWGCEDVFKLPTPLALEPLVDEFLSTPDLLIEQRRATTYRGLLGLVSDDLLAHLVDAFLHRRNPRVQQRAPRIQNLLLPGHRLGDSGIVAMGEQ